MAHITSVVPLFVMDNGGQGRFMAMEALGRSGVDCDSEAKGEIDA